MPESEIMKIVIQGGAIGILAALLVWWVGWGFPAAMAMIREMFTLLVTANQKEAAEQRAFMLEALDKMVAAREKS